MAPLLFTDGARWFWTTNIAPPNAEGQTEAFAEVMISSAANVTTLVHKKYDATVIKMMNVDVQIASFDFYVSQFFFLGNRRTGSNIRLNFSLSVL